MREQKQTTAPTLDPATGTGAALLEIITSGAAAIHQARAELATADELASQGAVYADLAADRLRALIDHAPAGSHTREALKDVQAHVLAAGVNVQMGIYRARGAADLLSTTG